MEHYSFGNLPDKNESSTKSEVAGDVQPEVDMTVPSSQPVPCEDIPEVPKVDPKDFETVTEHMAPALMDSFGEANMEASIAVDDMIRAGGFGARDDIGCFLPVASDSTDFEASLRDAREYEDLQEETFHPGLGWTEDPK